MLGIVTTHLKLDARYWDDMLAGRKPVTIRAGWLHVPHRTLRFEKTPGTEIVLVRVLSFECTTLSMVRVDDLIQDGFYNRASALKGLREFYPDLEFESQITVIRLDVGAVKVLR